jgi:hypothetical protein
MTSQDERCSSVVTEVAKWPIEGKEGACCAEGVEAARA